MISSIKRPKGSWTSRIALAGLAGLTLLQTGCIGPVYALPAWLAYTTVYFDFVTIPVRSVIGGLVLDAINGAVP